jgi:hypothetical protein
MIEAVRKANPAVEFNLEMITRDPLRVPCLTESYWATMESAPASQLARALAVIKQNRSAKPLPKTTGLPLDQQLALEDENVRQSIRYGREQFAPPIGVNFKQLILLKNPADHFFRRRGWA